MTNGIRNAALEASKVSVEDVLRRDRAVERVQGLDVGFWNPGQSKFQILDSSPLLLT
jgi:hypothetical protein